MSKQVRSQGWYQASHQQIYDTAQKFDTSRPTAEAKPFHDHANEMSSQVTAMGKTIQGIVADDWRGKAAQAMQSEYNTFFQDVDNYVQRMHEFGDKLPPVEPHIQAAKNIPAPMSGLQEATLRGSLAGSGKSRQDIDAAVAKKREEDQDFARYQMTGQFSEPVVSNGSNASMDDTPPGSVEHRNDIFQGAGGGGQNGGGSGGGQGAGGANNATDGLANKDTKPAYSDGSGNQSGQGQGAGSGSGSGSGGGSPQSGSGGGSGSGLGNALSGLGGGSDKSGSGLPLGSTTAAGYSSPSGSGSGTGTLSGPGALRGGAGVPGLGGGTGTNPAGIGGAGVRGGAMGMGGMGMAPMGGAHGHGGKGEEDDEHETPEFLINWDNGNELFGDLPKASPGVIGDWTEHERAEKQRRESEIRRYKSMGWNVDFGDER
nr:WXG100 family type VII secretion target [Mycobacteroides franklinii]